MRTEFTSIGLPASRNQQLFAIGNVLIDDDERERESAWVCVGVCWTGRGGGFVS